MGGDNLRTTTDYADRKLTDHEFQTKYWQGGSVPNQYHTMMISDGRDEREQLIINNIRALKDETVTNRTMMAWKGRERDRKTAAAIAVTAAGLAGLNLATVIILCRYIRRILPRHRNS